MENPVLIAIIGAVAGLISGAVASLIAPWVQWGVEKRKAKRENRQRLLTRAREIVLQVYDEHEKLTESLIKGEAQTTSLYPRARTYLDALERYEDFHAIKPSLNPQTLDGLRNARLFKVEDRGTELGTLPIPFQRVMDEVARLEKEWNLV